MARYSRDLYTRLEAETGHSTGFREIGHLHLACTPERLETLRRERAFQRGFGIDNVEVSAAEVAELTPITRVDDVLAASYVADEGRADPVGVATALAKGARALGVTVVTGVSMTGIRTDARSRRGRPHRPGRGRVRDGRAGGRPVDARARAAVRDRRTPAGRGALLPAHRADAGRPPRPARRRGPRPLRLLPRGGRRAAGRPVRAGGRRLAPRRPARGLRLRHDRAGLGPDDAPPGAGDVALPRPGGRGPADLLLRTGVLHSRRPPAARPGAGGAGRPHRGGHEQPRHPQRRWRRQRRGAVDRRRPTAGRRHPLLGRARPAVRDHPALPRRAGRGVLGRALRRRRLAELPVAQRSRRTTLGAARQAGRSRRAVRPVGRLGVPALLRRARPNRPRAAEPTWRRTALVPVRRGGAPRGPGGRRRDGHVADVEVPGAGARCRSRAEPAVGQPGRRRPLAGRLHAVVRRRGRTADRPDRHQARRRPVPGRLQRRHPSARRDHAPPGTRVGRGRDHHRRDAGDDAALGPGSARPRPAGVPVTGRLVRRRVPLPDRPRGRGGVVPLPRPAGHLRR